MASSTAPVMPLAMAVMDEMDRDKSSDPEKQGGFGHPITAAHSGPNTIYIDPVAERKLVRKQDMFILPAVSFY
jgi:hypothetical protein